MTTTALAPSIAAVTLSPQQLELQAKFKEFTEREIKPVTAAHDAVEDPVQGFPWEVWRKAARLGYRTLAMPSEHGGIGMDVLTHTVLLEELCAGDGAFGAAFHQVWRLSPLLLRTDYLKQEVLPKFLADDDYMFCFALTEPDAGTDNLFPYPGADGGSRTRADRQPNGDWVVNGMKHFNSFGRLAKGSFVICRTDFTKGMGEGSTFLFVDHATPGFRFGHVFHKLGWRLHVNTELIFEDVKVPDGARVGEVNRGLAAIASFGRRHAAATAAMFIGVARRAYEETFQHCQALSSGGNAATDRQTVQMRLADMWAEIEVARTITWKAVWSAEYNPNHDVKVGMAAQLFTSEMCIRVAASAMQLWAKQGFRQENPIEKLWRDAFVASHSDGLDDTIRLRIYRQLSGQAIGSLLG